MQDELEFEVETQKHVRKVRENINLFIVDLLQRASCHDDSKFEPPERELFIEATKNLRELTYNSPEYKKGLEKIQPALDHHYARNSHHPQHYKNGIDDMTLPDLLEMFADWKASSERHINGNIHKSIEVNRDRFNMSPQLARIFENTAKWIESQ
jgi:hypothetical protein